MRHRECRPGPLIAPLRALATLVACATLGACATVRPDACARRAIAGIDFAKMDDKQAHCIASGLIALECGARYAKFAGLGKEWMDAFGAGDPSRADLRANAVGRTCAGELVATVTGRLDALQKCCASRWPPQGAEPTS
jgi:hypothetical protein